MSDEPTDLTQVLADASAAGPPNEDLAKRLFQQIYDELRSLAEKYLRGERKDHTLEPTALVHEAFMKLIDQTRVEWKGRTHFYAVSAQAMRRILIDHARRRRRLKHGGDRLRVQLNEDAAVGTGQLNVLELEEALEQLAKLDTMQAQIVELRFFGGMTVEEVAQQVGVSKRKVEADWTHAKAWLRTKLDHS